MRVCLAETCGKPAPSVTSAATDRQRAHVGRLVGALDLLLGESLDSSKRLSQGRRTPPRGSQTSRSGAPADSSPTPQDQSALTRWEYELGTACDLRNLRGDEGNRTPNPRLAKLVHNIDISHYQQRQFADGHRSALGAHRLTGVRVTSRVTETDQCPLAVQ